MCQLYQLTCQDCRHEGCEHKEKHTEEKAASIVEHFTCFIADAQVEQANEDAHCQVGDEAQAGQGLGQDI